MTMICQDRLWTKTRGRLMVGLFSLTRRVGCGRRWHSVGSCAENCPCFESIVVQLSDNHHLYQMQNIYYTLWWDGKRDRLPRHAQDKPKTKKQIRVVCRTQGMSCCRDLQGPARQGWKKHAFVFSFLAFVPSLSWQIIVSHLLSDRTTRFSHLSRLVCQRSTTCRPHSLSFLVLVPSLSWQIMIALNEIEQQTLLFIIDYGHYYF